MPVQVLDLMDGEISEYEKIIISGIAAYLRVNPTGLTISQWYDIAQFLSISITTLRRMLDSISKNNEFEYSKLKMNGDVIDLTECGLNYKLFECLLNYYFICICINKILGKDDKETFIHNYKLYQIVLHNMNMMNINSGAFECCCNQRFSREYAPQSFGTFHPTVYMEILEPYLFAEYFDAHNSNLPALYRIINYQIQSHVNSMYLIVVSQILKHTTFQDESIRCIAEELYDNLHFLLKDARLISIHTNNLYQDLHKSFQERNRQTDNTTRFHIIYGFDNYDSYSLRLDLSHEGIGWVHYNNESPGGVKSCFFNLSEYESIIRETPYLEKCFINYGDRWFLKEKCNCALNTDEKILFERIQSKKEHADAFKNIYSEENVLQFLSIINDFTLQIASKHVDKDGMNAKLSFNFDKLVGWLELYYICKMSSDTEGANQLVDLIVSRGINYGIILPADKNDFTSEDGILLIIELAYDRCFQNSETSERTKL